MNRRAGETDRAFWDAAGDPKTLQRYRALVDAVDDGIAVVDAGGELTFVNERTEAIFGCSGDGLGEFFREPSRWNPVDEEGDRLEAAALPFSHVLDRAETVSDQTVGVRRPSGERVWLSVDGAPQWTENEELDGAVFVLEEITDRRRSENGHQTEYDLVEGIVETSPVGITVVNTDGELTFANERAEEILGRSREEIDEYAHDDPRWDLVGEDGESLGAGEAPFDRVVSQGEAIYDQVVGLRRPSGEHVWISVNGAPQWTDDGDLERAVFAFQDVTEQRDLKSELEEILGRVTDAFYALDDQWRFTHVNERAEELLQAPADELLGEKLWELYPEAAEIDDVWDAFHTAMETKETQSYELYYEPLEFWVEATVYPSETGVSVYFRDVTDHKKRERALEKSERRYRTLVENVPNGAVALVDEDLRYVTFGGTAAAIPDLTSEDIEGSPVRDALPEELADLIVSRYEAALDGETTSFEETIDGSVYQFHFVPVRDEDGAVFAAMGMSQDVTERHEYERHLKRFEAIVESVNDGVYVVGEDGTFRMVNERYTEMLGYDRDELVGADASMIVDEDVIEEVEGLHEETVVGRLEQPSIETEIRTASGDPRPIEATFAPVPDDDGDWHRVGVVRDISDRKERERALAESERRYRTLVENFPKGAVGLFDDDLEYTAVGGQLLEEVGVTPEERIGNSVYELYPHDLVDEIEPYFQSALDGESNTFQVEFHDRYLHAYTLPVRNAADEIIAGMLVVQDVTDRRRYERQLEKSNERLEHFAHAASHDLQEPLRMVSSYLQLLEHRYEDELDKDGQEFLGFAVDGADRMREMVASLLEYSRVETRGDPFESVDLEDVLADVREDLQLKIETSDATITAEDLPRVEGDANQLHQVFQNLLENAITYSGEEPPRIHVSAERREALRASERSGTAAENDGPAWVLSVRDEGIGIEPDEQDRIFEVFNRLHSREEYDGTGIGLALCERIVERHGGEIWVDSEPGEGSTFSVTLPATSDHDT
ncbi:hypothetical protein CV102_23215 [Natronococcus pandeyae]|uniref:histidine kinase n=1 Tax=Natronococcus pandeyae TaxID=2055836 RepID=A0A8J8Q059_9EURY|nr:PAS domain S-box protein [Natronococcus pandeyae]TYL36364.1 hypothetical protein CV102_23215 [Natronococcus pandeyae]